MAAGRKEYEMLFQLNAQLGSGYNSTFSKAQSQIAAMQKEITTLSKTQSDISAYQKQQSSIEGTRQKLVVLQQQYDNIQREIQETGTYSSTLENKLLSKQQQIEKTTAAIDRQNEKLAQMGQALNKAGIDTDNLKGELARLGGEIDDLKQKQEEAADGASDFGDKSVSAFGAIQTAIVSAGIAEALEEIVEAYMECVTVSGDFEASMSNVEALSGATKEELALLTATAKELGATTVFTAQQSADAMGYMAMAGWDAADMVSGMDGVLNLAAASGEDLALVSDIVTDNLTAFGLTAADTARFADVLAAAATNSNTSVSIMGETFKMSASVAGALGYSVEDVAVAVGLMANSGIKGSVAGTALKNTFNGLLEGVTLTGAAFGEYEYSAVQADGTMKDFSGTIDELRGYFEQMTEAERVNNAMTIAGARGYNGLLAILNATDADYASLAASINNCSGAASKMAAIKLDNLNGDLAIMNSASEGLQITLGDLYNNEMRSLYTLGGELFSLLDRFIQQNPALAKGIMAFVGVLAAATAALTTYAAITKVVIPLMKLFTASIPGVGPFFAITAGVAALTGVVVGLSAAADKNTDAIHNMTAASREDYYQLQELKAEYASVCDTYGETSVEAQYLSRQLEDLTAEYEANKQTAEELEEETLAVLDAHRELMNSYQETELEIDREARSNANLISKLEELMQAEYKTAATKQEILTIVEMLNEEMPQLGLAYDQYADSLNMSAEAIKQVARAELEREQTQAKHDQLKALLSEEAGLYDTLQKNIDEATARQKEYDEAVKARKEREAELGLPGPSEAAGREYAGAILPYAEAVNKTKRALDEARAAEEAAQQAWDENQSGIDNLSKALSGYSEETGETTTTAAALNERISETTAEMESLAEAYTLAYEAAYSSVSGQYSLWEEAAEVVVTSTWTMNNAIESQISYWQDYNSNLQSLTDRSADIEGLSEMLASFADGSTDSVNAVAGMARASDEELAAMVANWQALQTEQGNVADSIAELSTNFTEEMDALKAQLEGDIEQMNLSEEAAASGRNTIQGFIDGATDMLPQVQAAYAQVANAAMDAIDNALDINSPSREMEYRAEMTWAGYINQTREMEPEVMNAMSEAAGAGADATEIQLLSFAPQLIAALSGNRSSATDAVSGYHAAPVSVEVTFQIEGNATPEVVDALDQYGEEFAERVLAVVTEAGIDATRRSY